MNDNEGSQYLAFIKLHLIIKCSIVLCLPDTWGILNVS